MRYSAISIIMHIDYIILLICVVPDTCLSAAAGCAIESRPISDCGQRDARPRGAAGGERQAERARERENCKIPMDFGLALDTDRAHLFCLITRRVARQREQLSRGATAVDDIRRCQQHYNIRNFVRLSTCAQLASQLSEDKLCIKQRDIAFE